MNDVRKSPPEAEEASEPSGRKADPELLCMSRMVRILDEIEAPARGRVVSWLAARFADQAQAAFRALKGVPNG